jgi:hypothetical protein
MNTKFLRGVFATLLIVALTVPGLAFANGGGKGCSLQGTWFGVTDLGETMPTGWMVTVTGQSNSSGTNNLEYPTFDVTLGGFFPAADRMSTLRGAWERTGGNTFAYTMIGFVVDADGAPVWIAKLSGNITLVANCNYERIAAKLEIFLPGTSPFDGFPFHVIEMPIHYGYRAYVDMP